MTSRTIALLCVLALAGCGGPSTSSAPPATAARPAPAEAPPPAPEPGPDVAADGAFAAPMPVAVTSFGGASDGEALYVLGGYHGEPHNYSREGQSRALSRWTPEGGWEQLSELDAGVQGVALIAHDGAVCRFGGNRIHNPAGEPADMRSLDEAACFSGGAWTELPAMPAARSSHEAARIGSKVYVAGGWALAGEADDAQWADTVAVLDLASPDAGWESIEAPFTRRALGVAAADGKLVVIGGLNPERSIEPRVDVYDPESGEWSRGPDFPADAFGLAAIGVGDAVYASARDGVVYRFRPGEQEWSRHASLAFPRFFHQLLPVGQDLVAVGGISGMHTRGRTRALERVALEGPGPRVSTLELAYPGQAKNRQGMFVHGDDVYFFGGNNSLGQHDFEPNNFLAEGWRLHLPSMTFAPAADFPAQRQTMQTMVVGDRGIAVGGFGHDGNAAVTHPEGFAFDFEEGQWTPAGGLPRGRTQFGLTAHDGALWIFGGLNYDPSREGEAAFDHVTNVLRAAPGEPFQEVDGVELPGPRRAFAGASHGGRYYVVGGMREGFQLVDDCLAYDYESQDWAEIACPARTRLSGMLIPVGERLFLVGGSYRTEDGMVSDRTIEVYDPASNTWSEHVAELPFDTKHMRAFRYHDRLLLTSTHNEDGRLHVAFVTTD